MILLNRGYYTRLL